MVLLGPKNQQLTAKSCSMYQMIRNPCKQLNSHKLLTFQDYVASSAQVLDHSLFVCIQARPLFNEFNLAA